MQGDYAQAKIDYDNALALNPTADFPYAFSMMLALREGRISDAVNFMQIIVTEFPDTTLSKRMVSALSAEDIVFGPIFSAVGNLILGQYEAALVDIDASLAADEGFAESYMLKGLAHCNLDEYEEAEAAYSAGISIDPDLAILYMLRADVRFSLGDTQGSLEDAATARNVNLSDEFNALLDAGLTEGITCKNFFEYQP